jgi:hypothetical protein
MQEIYQRVADTFAARINEVFLSEETLAAEFKKSFEHLEFSRTDHGSTLLNKMFRDCWKTSGPEAAVEPTGYDKLAVLRCLYHLLDYNLFTQVLLNLQSYTGMAYLTKDAEDEIEKLKASWPKDAKLSPFEPKAKMVKNAATDEEKQHNNILSTIKSLKIISQFTPQVSFRVSPIGSTPAFADSRNISMIGAGGDKYLRTLPNLKPFYIHWAPGSTPGITQSVKTVQGDINNPVIVPDPSGTQIIAAGIPYPFFSKSGGDILNEVLFARMIMAEVFAAHDITAEMCIMIPRMNSVLIVTDQNGLHLKRAFENLKAKFPLLELAEGVRSAN